MNKTGLVLGLVFLVVLGVTSASAEQTLAENAALTVVPLLSPASTLCTAAPASQDLFQIPAIELTSDDPAGPILEACFPAECGSGASQQQCSSSCCRNKCCIC